MILGDDAVNRTVNNLSEVSERRHDQRRSEHAVHLRAPVRTHEVQIETYPDESTFVYKSQRKNILLVKPSQKDAYRSNELGKRSRAVRFSAHDSTRAARQAESPRIDKKTRVKSYHTGTTQYGFPSTLSAGKRVALVGDPDPAIENPDLVTRQAFLQTSIQSLRKEMKEQGNG